MTNCFVTLFRLKIHMISFLDRLLDVVSRTYYCVARVTCPVLLISIHVEKLFLYDLRSPFLIVVTFGSFKLK